MKALKVKYNDISSSMRFNSGYHLSEGTIYLKKLRKMPHKELDEIASNIFTAGRSKRVYTKEKYGYPYLSNSDVVRQRPFDDCKYNSKKYGYDEASFLKEGMVVTGRVGAIGQTAYITSELEELKAMGSDNIIRILTKENEKSGFIYAFLASKYGNTLLWKLAAGGVQPYISEDMLRDMPIPKLTDSKQQEIHNLIVEASNLRVEANNLLNEAVNLMEKKLPSIEFRSIYKAKISARINHNSRIEATYNTNSIEGFYEALEQSNTELRSISELSEQVFTPGIFKRIRTNNPEKGVPFLSGSDLLNQYPNFQSFLSRKMKNIDNYILHDGWLAIQDAGTIGYLSYITKFLDGVSATNNLVRVVPNEDDNKNYYIYCFLKTKVGQRLLKSLEYGSVQKHIDNHQVSNFKVPMFNDIEEEITRKVKKCMDNLGDACFLEKEAIDLVEKEIESWQK